MSLDNDASIKLYQSISDGNEERVMKKWHASSLAMCPRAQYMQRLGVKAKAKPPSASMVLRWTAGHLIEEAIQPHISKIVDGTVESNVRHESKKLDLTGEYDNFSKKDKTIVEIKSVHDYAFVERDGHTSLKIQDGFHPNGNKRWLASDKPYLHHEIQNHAYVMLLAEKGIKVEKIKYVYISLSGRIVTYDTDVQEELIENVTERLKALNKAWKDKKPPVCICIETHNLYAGVMQYCPYKEEDKCCVVEEK